MTKYTVKILAIIAAILMVIGCASCGGKEKSEQPTAAATVRVTFPEGITVDGIAKLLGENGVCTESDFIDSVNAQGEGGELTALIDNISERPFAFEGYLFPDTYDFYVGESPQNALSRFLNNMSNKLTDIWYARAAELGYGMDDIIIIASIIQTEAGRTDEMKNVSSVLHNRLESTGYLNRLQCDATYFYVRDHVMPFLSQTEPSSDTMSETEPAGVGAGIGMGTETQTEAENGLYEQVSALYNTYNFGGLPAGPICNPGAAAIEAALYPADTNYFYFVTDAQGNYYYSETYTAHAQKCAELGIKTA